MFKVGDRVRVIKSLMSGCALMGDELLILMLHHQTKNGLFMRACFPDNPNRFFGAYSTELQVIEPATPEKKPIMKKLNNMMKRLLDADTQTLVKAEYINGDLELTGKGQEALYSVLFADKKADLVALAQVELDDTKKSS